MNKFPNITVDAIVFSYFDEKLHVLLIKRNFDPFKDNYALPGAFIKEDESADDAVYRHAWRSAAHDGTQLPLGVAVLLFPVGRSSS